VRAGTLAVMKRFGKAWWRVVAELIVIATVAMVLAWAAANGCSPWR
jgi:hypothetical protein